MTVPDDQSIPALEGIADTLDEAASQTRSGSRRLRRLSSEKMKGRSWREVLGGGSAWSLLQLLASASSGLSGAVGRLRRVVAEALLNDGLRVGQIAETLGVSHQRISRVLGSGQTGIAQRG